MGKEKCLLEDHTSAEKCKGIRKSGKSRVVIQLCKKMAVSPLIHNVHRVKEEIADIKYLRGAGG